MDHTTAVLAGTMTIAEGTRYIRQEQDTLTSWLGADKAPLVIKVVDELANRCSPETQLRIELEKGQLLFCAFNFAGTSLGRESHDAISVLRSLLSAVGIEQENWVHPNGQPGSTCIPPPGNPQYSPNLGGYKGTGP